MRGTRNAAAEMHREESADAANGRRSSRLRQAAARATQPGSEPRGARRPAVAPALQATPQRGRAINLIGPISHAKRASERIGLIRTKGPASADLGHETSGEGRQAAANGGCSSRWQQKQTTSYCTGSTCSGISSSQGGSKKRASNCNRPLTTEVFRPQMDKDETRIELMTAQYRPTRRWLISFLTMYSSRKTREGLHQQSDSLRAPTSKADPAFLPATTCALHLTAVTSHKATQFTRMLTVLVLSTEQRREPHRSMHHAHDAGAPRRLVQQRRRGRAPAASRRYHHRKPTSPKR